MTARDYLGLLRPRFRYGDITPTAGVRRGPGYEFYRIVPLDVMQVTVGLGIKDYTPDGVEDAMGRFWPCVDTLVKEGVDSIRLGGAPISSQLGRERVRALLGEVKERTGIPGYASMEAISLALLHLGARTVAIGSRWADQLNAAVARYLEEAGLEVVHVTSRGQWAGEAFAMTLEQGLQMALDVGREAIEAAPQADAVLVPGGSAFSLHVIPALEDEFGKPVLTNLNAEVWNTLIEPGVIEPVQGWGRLLSSG